MAKKLFLFIACLTMAAASGGENKVSVITEKGAWCWFADPRALHYENESGTINSTYIGYIDVNGNIKATQINHLANIKNEVLVRSYFQPDDHDNPTFLVLPDERVMIFYSRHTDEPCFYYRISQKPGDITTLGKEIKLATADNTTYPSPFILADDPEHIYLCWRGINWHPTIARLTLPDENDKVMFDWGPYQIVSSKESGRGVRPYAKYISDGKGRIYLAYTTTHPDNQSINYVYLNYIDIKTRELKDIKDNSLAIIGSGALHNVDATEAYKNSYPYAVVDDAPFRDWIWEVSLDAVNNPVIAMTRISDDKSSHDYFHAKWTGDNWRKTFLDNAGGHFHQSPDIEKCYSGGMAIDKNNPNIIYGSVPVEGKYGKVYELKKYTVAENGTLESVEQLTFDSQKNNARPYMISSSAGNVRHAPGSKNLPDRAGLVWMNGDYYDWIVSSVRPQGYPTAIHTFMYLPQDKIDIKKDLLLQKSYGKMTPERKEKIKVARSEAFTISLTLSLDHDAYYGEIINTGNFSYGITPEEAPMPYVKTGTKTYTSTNLLGSSDAWKTKNRGTGGQWHTPEKLNNFNLTISYENGKLRTYINGLADQYIEIEGFTLSDVTIGGFKGEIKDARIYNRVLSQDEIKF